MLRQLTTQVSDCVCVGVGRVACILLTAAGRCRFDSEIITGNGSVLVLAFAGAGRDGFAKLGLCRTGRVCLKCQTPLKQQFSTTYTRFHLLFSNMYNLF